MTLRSSAVPDTSGISPVKALIRSITNVDKRLRIVEKREVPAASDGGGTPVTDANYVHTQSSPSVTWTVVHNLGKFPTIAVVDTGGSVVIPDVHYVNVNTITVTFGSATSGQVFCN